MQALRKKKKKTWSPNLTPSPGRVQASREGPNTQSYLKFLTNKMAQIFIILYLIPEPQNLIRWGEVRWAFETWERRRAENRREAGAEELQACCLAWALSCSLLSRWEQTEQWRLETRERRRAESREKGKIFRVLICG